MKEYSSICCASEYLKRDICYQSQIRALCTFYWRSRSSSSISARFRNRIGLSCDCRVSLFNSQGSKTLLSNLLVLKFALKRCLAISTLLCTRIKFRIFFFNYFFGVFYFFLVDFHTNIVTLILNYYKCRSIPIDFLS